MGDDDEGSRSLFVVVCYVDWALYACSVVQLDTKPPKNIGIIDTKYFAHIKYNPPRLHCLRPSMYWSFVAPPSSTNDLYIVPDSRYIGNQLLHGATLSCSTKTFQPMKPHEASSMDRIAVNVGQDIYFLAHPHMYKNYSAPEPASFERYSPAEDTWYKEEPFPYHGIHNLGHDAHIVANAVWDDIIILNMGGLQIWAYPVSKRKWYRVLVGDEEEDNGKIFGDDKMEVGVGDGDGDVHGDPDTNGDDRKDDSKHDDGKDNYLCYAIIGEGCVVKNTIYALSKLSFSSVVALSIEKKEGAGGDLQFGCSLRSEINVPFMTPFEHGCCRTRHFVHLGGDKFCLVQSSELWDDSDYQPIQVTYMKLEREDEMVVTNIVKYSLSMPKDQLYDGYHVGFCFSHPECNTIASKQGETTFIFDPYNGFSSKQGYEIDINIIEAEVGKLIQEERNVTLPKDIPLLIDVESTSVLFDSNQQGVDSSSGEELE